MTITTRTISVPLDSAGTELFKALGDFSASRSTRAMARRNRDRDVYYDIRVPFLPDCRIGSRALWRGMRTLIRQTMDGAEPGDCAVIDFALTPDGHLALTLSPWEPPSSSGRP